MRISAIIVLVLGVALSISASIENLKSMEKVDISLVQEVEAKKLLIEEDAVIIDFKEEVFNKCKPEIYEEPKKNINIENIIFVGNSLVEGLRMYSDLDNPFLSKVGVSLEGLKPKYYDLLKQYNCETVVIGMGTNELGSYSKEDFIFSYIDLIKHIRTINSDSNIICLSIPPVTSKKSNSNDNFNNYNVNVYNEYIKELCESENLIYLDNGLFFGEVLNSDWSGDGIHLKGNIYREWCNYIIKQIMDM